MKLACFLYCDMFFVQIQGESMHLVSLGSQVINSTMVSNPEFLALLPEGMNEVVSSALDDAYLYGREWIQSMVRFPMPLDIYKTVI